MHVIETEKEEKTQVVTIVPFEDILYAKYDKTHRTVVLGLHRRYGSLPVALEFEADRGYDEFIGTLEGMESSAIVMIRPEDMQVGGFV